MNLEKISQYESILEAIRVILRNPQFGEQFREDLEIILLEGETTLEQVNKKVTDLHSTITKDPLITEAQSIYRNIPLENLKNELIDDFINMELAYRRGDLKYYFLCLYKQFENLIKTVFEFKKEYFYKLYEENKHKTLKTENGEIKLIEFIITKKTVDGSINDLQPLNKIFEGVQEKYKIISYHFNPLLKNDETGKFIEDISNLRHYSTHRNSLSATQVIIYNDAKNRPLYYKLKHIKKLNDFSELCSTFLNLVYTKNDNISKYNYISIYNLINFYNFNLTLQKINFSTQNNKKISQSIILENISHPLKKITIELRNDLKKILAQKKLTDSNFSIQNFLLEYCSLYLEIKSDKIETILIVPNYNKEKEIIKPFLKNKSNLLIEKDFIFNFNKHINNIYDK